MTFFCRLVILSPSVPITKKSGPFELVGARLLFREMPSALPSST